jgi:O-succinylbenzoate synthase
MKIEAITLREIQMPLVHFFETSFGRTYSRRILLVTVHCDGVNGWGECVAGEDPFYSSEWIESARLTITHYLAPMLIGKNVAQGREGAVLMAKVRGHRMAKASLENALWDAEARAKQQPLWKLLGGTRREIPCGVSIGIQDSPEQLLEKIQTELSAGYRRIKIKVSPAGTSTSWKKYARAGPTSPSAWTPTPPTASVNSNISASSISSIC